MCGIAGYFGQPDSSLPKRTLVDRMIAAIAYRGPDANGVFIDDSVGLGHARLSIIDVATGQQPMTNSDGSVHLTFGGEIFNYIELRRDLISRGHRFRTTSDTEVVLQAYEESGVDCVESFNGDFAFALWDSRRRLFMLARDRMGVRPLFHTMYHGCLYFASEAKALLQVPGISAELDPVVLDQVFTLGFPLPSRTLFKGIEELPPGHRKIETPRLSRTEAWWSLSYPDASDAAGHDNRDDTEIADELRALLLDATAIRLRSDVPVGAYLSGGLDSSTVTALIQRIRPQRLRTFSVTFESSEFDESPWQNAVVEQLGTEHATIRCRTDDIAALFPTLIRHVERNLLRTSSTPMMALSGLVHDSGYKVVLTGEGADELFAGYDIFKEAALRRFCARQPEAQWRTALYRRLYPYLPTLTREGLKQRQLSPEIDTGLTNDPLFSHVRWFETGARSRSVFSGDLQSQLHGYDACAELRDDLPPDFARWHHLHQAQYIESAYRLPGYILSSKGDRAAMANAVETRFPFLDHRIVTFSTRLPPGLNLRGLKEKRVLRQAVRDLLPDSILGRVKQPYRAPGSPAFLGSGAPSYVADRLTRAETSRTGYFDPRAVEWLVAANRQPKAGSRYSAALIGVLSTQLWHAAFCDAAAGS